MLASELSMIDPFGGNTKDYTTLKKGLLELQPNLTFDEGSNDAIYMFNEEMKMRAGIYWNGQYISAVERGVMPELTLFSEYKEQVIPCSLEEVLADEDGTKTWAEEIWVVPGTEKFAILDMMIGAAPALTLKQKNGNEIWLLRIQGHIVISTGKKMVVLPTHVIRIGWREVLERCLDMKIPLLTREALEKKFGISLAGPKRSDLQLVTSMTEVGL